jgi:hypothetical protein
MNWRIDMNLGMLWFDNDPKTDLPHKIDRAARYYHKKYGETPTLCIVNPKMTEDKKLNGCCLEVKTNQSILNHHLWIGVAVEKEEKVGI